MKYFGKFSAFDIVTEISQLHITFAFLWNVLGARDSSNSDTASNCHYCLGIACWWESDGLVIRRLRVWIPAGAAGKFSSPELTYVLTLIRCPFHPHVTAVACKRPRSFFKKCRCQVTLKHAYTLTQWSRSGLTMPLEGVHYTTAQA